MGEQESGPLSAGRVRGRRTWEARRRGVTLADQQARRSALPHLLTVSLCLLCHQEAGRRPGECVSCSLLAVVGISQGP